MGDLTPEQMRRMHDFAEQLAELAEHQEDQWKVQTTDGQIFLTMMSPTAPHGLNVVRLRRQIEAQTPEVMALNDTNMGDPQTGLTKVPDLMVIAEEDTDDTAKVVNSLGDVRRRWKSSLVRIPSLTSATSCTTTPGWESPCTWSWTPAGTRGPSPCTATPQQGPTASASARQSPTPSGTLSPPAAGLWTRAASRVIPPTGERHALASH